MTLNNEITEEEYEAFVKVHNKILAIGAMIDTNDFSWDSDCDVYLVKPEGITFKYSIYDRYDGDVTKYLDITKANILAPFDFDVIAREKEKLRLKQVLSYGLSNIANAENSLKQAEQQIAFAEKQAIARRDSIAKEVDKYKMGIEETKKRLEELEKRK